MTQAQTVAIPKRWPLVTSPANRGEDTDKDAKLVNCYAEKDVNDPEVFWIYKRPGLLEDATYSETGAGQGCYNWRGDVYFVFGTSLFRNGTSVGTVDATGGCYRFSSCLGSTPKLQLGNGAAAYNYDTTSGLVAINDADFVTPFVKGWAYLDGTTYYMTSNASIRGSDINDPVNWDALNLIIAQIEPDGGVALAKQLVYVIAFKQWTTEVFYDAANSTGSPLGTVQGAKLNHGCVSADSVRELDGILFWVSTNRSASTQVMMLDNLKIEAISTNPIERLLDEADFTTVYSWVLKHDGHRFYILTVVNENLTLVYDLDERRWCQWTDADGNYLPIIDSTYVGLEHLLQHATNGKVYKMSSSYTNDDGDVFPVDIVTPNFDGGTRRRKQLNMMEFVADQTPGSVLQVRKNDNDYDPTKWSNYRSVDLNSKKPILTNCGSFSRRAYHLHHKCNTRLRIKAVELQVDLGTL